MLNEGTRKSNDEVVKRKTNAGDLLKLQAKSAAAVPQESSSDLGPLLSEE